jgi:hypothetical protein
VDDVMEPDLDCDIFDIPAECEKHLQQLKNIREHILPPGALASGQRGLAHKAAALVYMWHLEVGPSHALADFAESFESNTGDMGTEISLPDFVCSRRAADDLLPDWVQRQDLANDLEEPGHVPAVDSGSQVHLMPNALTIAGLQHIVNNLSEDVHKGLDHWDTFHSQLKNFEQMLKLPERRRRFFFTCVRGTAFANKERAILHFHATLYEKRWKEVLTFLKMLKSLLPVFRACWCHQKYQRGVDGTGERFVAEDDVEDGNKFKPLGITEAIQNSFFNRYVAFALAVEEIPQQRLAAWGEGCSCHERLFQNLSDHRRMSLYKRQFGEGYTCCPMHGKRAPELADGRLHAVLQEAWDLATHDVLFGFIADLHPLTESERIRFQSDITKAKVTIETVLTVKLQYYGRLPWLLCGLALADESRARAIGVKAISQFEQDPREAVHHRKTWALMQPQSQFRAQLQSFVQGQQRWSCGPEFSLQVAKLRLVPVVETTIEEKHSRVSLDKKRHHIGPVRVSLANRLPLFFRTISRDPSALQDLLPFFQQARSLKEVPPLLNLEGSPCLIGYKAWRHCTKLKALLSLVLYRCDMDASFRSLKSELKLHSKAKAKEQRLEALASYAVQRVDEPAILQRAFREHFIESAQTGVFYSLPASCGAKVQSLTSYLDQCASKRQRSAAVADDDDRAYCLDVEGLEHAPGQACQAPLFFQVVPRRPTNKKTVHVKCGAGSNLRMQDVAINIFKAVPDGEFDFSDSAIVESCPSSHHEHGDSIALLREFGNVKEIESKCLMWPSHEALYSLPLPAPHVSPADVGHFVTRLVQAEAFASSPKAKWLRVDGQDQYANIVSHLADAGFLSLDPCEDDDASVCALSDRALKMLDMSIRLSSPVAGFAPRENIPIADLSSYELIRRLQDEGWTWSKWKAPGKKRKQQPLELLGYRPGLAKAWHTAGIVPQHLYLQALLRAEDLWFVFIFKRWFLNGVRF